MKIIVVSIYRDQYDVYIGRAGKGQDGYFGNPFKPTNPNSEASRQKCLAEFQAYFVQRVEQDAEFRRRVQELKGKRLGCFCAPKGGLTATDKPWRCHGQIIAAYLDGEMK